MKRIVRALALVSVLALAATACSGNGGESASGSPSTPPEQLQRGGTLLVETNADLATSGFDPAKEYWQLSFQVFRCCLLRGLMTYNGLEADQGGAEIVPDLAADVPTVSDDGLTWTFQIQPGIHYSPPLQDVEVTAQDFVRAIEREADPDVAAGYGFYYTDIEGFQEYSDGKADTVTGATAVDDHTLQITLTQPAGDLSFRMALAAMAPIPPNPDDPNAKYGIAEGHNDDYGQFVIGTGPYMIEGAGDVDFSVPVKDQKPISGYEPSKHMSLVRNPSWDGATDPNRPAYLDGIDITISPGAEAAVLEKKVQNDELDAIMENSVEPQTLRTFKTDPNLENRIFTNPAASNYYLTMNLATPPFDDLHLRKAVEYAIDKDGWRKLFGGLINGEIAGHFVPDGDIGNLLQGEDYYPTPDSLGADSPEGLQAAKDEMAQSKYDSNQDGVCDAPECQNVLSVGVVGHTSEAQDQLISQNLQKIGIQLDVKSFENATAYGKVFDPKNHIPFSTFAGWIHDYPDAYTWFYPIMYGPNILDQYNTNYSMVGATPEQLKKYGYDVTDVPSMDAQIEKCFPLTGPDRTQCWADADTYLMTQIAPVVPLIFSNVTNIVSSRVLNFHYSAVDQAPSWEHLALVNGGA